MNILITIFLSLQLAPAFKPTLYLDPGSGSFIIQIAIGFIVGAIVVLKTYWARIRGFFAKEEPVINPDSPIQQPEENSETNA